MSTNPNEIVVAIDPGSNKCGVAVVNMQAEALQLHLVNRMKLQETLLHLLNQLTARDCQWTIVMGNGTQYKTVLAELQAFLPATDIRPIEEYGSTLAARELYWQHNKPSLWQRILPASWRSTPPLDAYAAWVIAKRYIEDIDR